MTYNNLQLVSITAVLLNVLRNTLKIDDISRSTFVRSTFYISHGAFVVLVHKLSQNFCHSPLKHFTKSKCSTAQTEHLIQSYNYNIL